MSTVYHFYIFITCTASLLASVATAQVHEEIEANEEISFGHPVVDEFSSICKFKDTIRGLKKDGSSFVLSMTKDGRFDPPVSDEIKQELKEYYINAFETL